MAEPLTATNLLVQNQVLNSYTIVHFVLNSYVFIRPLGSGAFGTVWLAWNFELQLYVAIKIIDKVNFKEKEVFFHAVASQLDGVVKIMDVFESQNDVCLVMEYCPTDLFTYIEYRGKIKEEEVKILFKQLVTTVKDLDSLSISHCDIKPENILVTSEGKLRLCDFGLSHLTCDEPRFHLTGTVKYSPPEWFSTNSYTLINATMWSLGIVLYEMVSGILSFNEIDEIVNGVYEIDASENCKQMLSLLLEPNPHKRTVSYEDVLNHAFLV